MQKGITIFTPTYNRAYRLTRLYKSLCDQSCHAFEWLIVDDGSTDDTKEMVNYWIAENKITIRYFWQENAGKAQAHNWGVELSAMPLFVCVDSDDFLLSNAVERIFALWKEHPGKIGIICAKQRTDHKPMTYWKGDVEYCTLYDAYKKYGLEGETMLIYRTDVIRRHRFPRFEGEKFVPEAFLYDRLDQEGIMYITDEAFYVAEYLPDGYTFNMHEVQKKNPYGFQAYIIQRLKLDKKIKYVIEDTWLYIDIKEQIGDGRLIADAVYPLLTWLLCFASNSKSKMIRLKNVILNFKNVIHNYINAGRK